MEVMHPRCAGLDAHKDTVVACVPCVSPPMHQKVRSFATTTAELQALADWAHSQRLFQRFDDLRLQRVPRLARTI